MNVADTCDSSNEIRIVDAHGDASGLQADVAAPFGQRLLAAREAHGWTRAEVAARLKLPAQLIARLERDDFEGLTEGVFLTGYLGSYARLVGIPIELANQVAAANTRAAPLIATGTISHTRYLLARYSVSATYLILTAIIVVPAVWLAMHGGLQQNLARTTPLDPPVQVASEPPPAAATSEVAPQTAGPQAGTPFVIESAVAPAAPEKRDQAPIIASMTPFVGPSAPARETSAPPARVAVAAQDTHTLSLKLDEQSWVEVTAADGRKLEYGMLAADTEHTYRSDGSVSVRLGNAKGVQMQADGASVDLVPYEHSNVASLTLFDGTGSENHVDQ